MVTETHYRSLQQLFFSRIVKQPKRIKVQFSEITSEGANFDFTGESSVQWSLPVELNCFYSRTISDATRDKYGISTAFSLICYLSPLELLEILGYQIFPDRVMNNYNGIRFIFEDEEMIVKKILELEKIELFDGIRALGIMIVLQKIA